MRKLIWGPLENDNTMSNKRPFFSIDSMEWHQIKKIFRLHSKKSFLRCFVLFAQYICYIDSVYYLKFGLQTNLRTSFWSQSIIQMAKQKTAWTSLSTFWLLKLFSWSVCDPLLLGLHNVVQFARSFANPRICVFRRQIFAHQLHENSSA